jgi:hypothetical protein
MSRAGGGPPPPGPYSPTTDNRTTDNRQRRYLSRSLPSPMAAWAAASLAMGTRKGGAATIVQVDAVAELHALRVAVPPQMPSLIRVPDGQADFRCTIRDV